jgi:tetratricopeptide (TPR) repeat protein
MTAAQLVAIAAVVLPALAFALWPLARSRGEAAAEPGVAAGDRALGLLEEKTAVYRALKELAFDHEAGHLSEDDYQALRERYESRAAELLEALDALQPATAATGAVTAAAATAAPAAGPSWTRHPLTLAGGAVLLVVFGVVLGINAGRFSESDQSAMPAGSRLPAPASPQAGGSMPPVAGMEPGKPISPEVFAGMLGAARQSLEQGRYPEAIAAYQAVLKRDPRNVDAMTHLGLIVAIGGHADSAIQTFDKALAIDPKYAPAYLYRGQVLYEVKQDYPGAVKAWERFLALVPSGQDHDRIAGLLKEARAKQPAR